MSTNSPELESLEKKTDALLLRRWQVQEAIAGLLADIEEKREEIQQIDEQLQSLQKAKDILVREGK